LKNIKAEMKDEENKDVALGDCEKCKTRTWGISKVEK